LLCYFSSTIFNVPPEYSEQMSIFMLIMVFSFIFQLRFIPSWSVVYAYQRFDLLNIYTGLRNISRWLLCFIVYSIFTPKLYYYGFIYFIAISVEQLLIVKGARRLFPEINVSIKGFSKPKMKELFSFMIFRTIQAIGSVLYTNTDMILINKFFGATYNAIYSISLKFTDVLKRLIQRSLWVLVPSFTELVARNEHERMERIYRSTTKASALISLPICIMLALFGKELIGWWVGKEFIEAANPMYVNLIAITPLLIFTPCGGVATALAKIKIPSFVALSCAVGNVFISLFCALKLGWGLVGFAFGTLVSIFVEYLIFHPYYSCKIAKIDYKSFFINSLIKPLLLCGVFGLTFFYIKFFAKISLLHTFVCIALSFPLYCYLSYRLILSVYEKNILKQAVNRMLTFLNINSSDKKFI